MLEFLFGKKRKSKKFPKKGIKSKIPKNIMKTSKKLKIKITRKTKTKNLKSNKNLFIQKANAESRRKGTVGTFGKWCKRNKLSDSSGRVTMKCIKKALKSGNTTLIRRANYARNIGGYVGAKHTKRTAIGLKRTAIGLKRTAIGLKRRQRGLSFGIIDQDRFDRFSQMNWEVPNSEFAKQSLRKVRRNCEDGESQILFNKIIPGIYVNLGNKKCLSVQEILEMSDTGKFLKNSKKEYINPFTRQPLTRKQLVKINDILRAAGRTLLGDVNQLMTIDEILEQGIDLVYVWEYLINRLRTENLSVINQKNMINLVSEMEDSSFRIIESDRNIKWQVVQGRIYIMTPSGWMLPENMGEEEWTFAGMNEQQYNEMIEEEEEQSPVSHLAPRRLFD